MAQTKHFYRAFIIKTLKYAIQFNSIMIITISGTAGSGKSTIANALVKKLNLKKYSVGDFRREQGQKLGLDINEYNKLGEKQDFTDKEADDWQTNLGKKEDNFIIDGRLSFYFIPNSFKLFLDADEKTRALRIFNDKRKTEKFKDLNEALNKIQQRQKSDEIRYEKYYNINPFNHKHYDLVIDTSKKNVDEIVELILKKIKSDQA